MSNNSNPGSSSQRDHRVLELYEQLLEIEQRLIPTGLHVFGRPSVTEERADVLRMIACFDRPEMGLRSLRDIISEGLISKGLDKQRVEDLLTRSVEKLLVEGAESGAMFLKSEADVDPDLSRSVFGLLDRVSTELERNFEIESLMRALRGEYIPPGPGADLVQNPQILPTGRNTHAINPYVVPSTVAFARGEIVANGLLERFRNENGRFPETIALVLWGLDNIKTQGEGVAQALWLLGVRPLRDALNRATAVEAIPLEELGRPRIDVVMTVSGIFRDLFSPTVQLLDKAVRFVAGLDEPAEVNFVRKHVVEQTEGERCDRDEATTRVFSNAPGNYGTNVNFMVLDSQWEQEETLGDLFVTRKCFAYGRDSKGNPIEGREARLAMDRALARVEATYQNIDTFEIGITDVDHYFEYLGGVSRAVEKRSHRRPAVYLSDSLNSQTKIRSLEETVRLETRAKTLNPKWYEGMLLHGFRGVAEIENHVSNTFGWSATADAVDDWIYTEVANTYVLDAQMLARLQQLNSHSAHSLVQRLLEANGRGYWETDENVLQKLRQISRSIEDSLEGAGVAQ
ncbi:MAG: cobaltochelatase subunit CobN [Pyrinomonadaceae bacterium]